MICSKKEYTYLENANIFFSNPTENERNAIHSGTLYLCTIDTATTDEKFSDS